MMNERAALPVSNLSKMWIDKINYASPIIGAVALNIAREAALDPSFDRGQAVKDKSEEWRADEKTARALQFAVTYYYDEMLANAGTQPGNEQS